MRNIKVGDVWKASFGGYKGNPAGHSWLFTIVAKIKQKDLYFCNKSIEAYVGVKYGTDLGWGNLQVFDQNGVGISDCDDKFILYGKSKRKSDVEIYL